MRILCNSPSISSYNGPFLAYKLPFTGQNAPIHPYQPIAYTLPSLLTESNRYSRHYKLRKVYNLVDFTYFYIKYTIYKPDQTLSEVGETGPSLRGIEGSWGLYLDACIRLELNWEITVEIGKIEVKSGKNG